MEDRTVSFRLSPVSSAGGLSCAEARDRSRGALAGLELGAQRREDVLTVVSELVANARSHAGGVTGFDVVVRSGAVIVEVSDRSPRLPRTRPWAPGLPGGFGWRLVNQLADHTRVRFRHGHKTVSAAFTTGRAKPR
ncbi:ATP-binding protein [Streptomyces subrutilus]|uniref:ATP-binding protein n=1 Tax=Streptomyces subrutilus TaxID=36818 RepID=UPI00340C96EB